MLTTVAAVTAPRGPRLRRRRRGRVALGVRSEIKLAVALFHCLGSVVLMRGISFPVTYRGGWSPLSREQRRARPAAA